ncbi:MAG: M23 family metallopeptidase [Bacillota bacterium]
MNIKTKTIKLKEMILYLKISKLLLIIIFLTFSLIPAFNSATCAQSDFDKNILINKTSVIQGEVIIVKSKNNFLIDSIKFNSSSYKVRKYTDGNISLIGVSYWLTPGKYQLEIKGSSNYMLSIAVLEGDFDSSYLQVNKDQENIISPEDKKIIERKEKDNLAVKKARSSSSDRRLWQDKFIWPVDGTISTEFGAQRYVNGKLQSRHSGIDIAAEKGTPVKAPADGTVKLTQNLLVTGNTVIIDHGWNLFSSYSHLNNISVKNNADIKKGDIIGYIGSTGFSTGPHLHWAVKLNDVFVNPRQFIDLNIIN